MSGADERCRNDETRCVAEDQGAEQSPLSSPLETAAPLNSNGLSVCLSVVEREEVE